MSNTLTINDKEYDVDSLSEQAKACIARLRYIDVGKQRLAAEADVLTVAENTFKNMLREELAKTDEEAA